MEPKSSARSSSAPLSYPTRTAAGPDLESLSGLSDTPYYSPSFLAKELCCIRDWCAINRAARLLEPKPEGLPHLRRNRSGRLTHVPAAAPGATNSTIPLSALEYQIQGACRDIVEAVVHRDTRLLRELGAFVLAASELVAARIDTQDKIAAAKVAEPVGRLRVEIGRAQENIGSIRPGASRLQPERGVGSPAHTVHPSQSADLSFAREHTMSVLDPIVHTMESYRFALEEVEDDELLAGRRTIPGTAEKIQKWLVSSDCGRWGNVADGLFNPTGWMTFQNCIKCRQHEAGRQKAIARGHLGHDRLDPGMWLAHIDESLHKEVAMLQLALLVDHNKYLRHDVAEKALESDRDDGRRNWIKDLKQRLSDAPTLPSLGYPHLHAPTPRPQAVQTVRRVSDEDTVLASASPQDHTLESPDPDEGVVRGREHEGGGNNGRVEMKEAQVRKRADKYLSQIKAAYKATLEAPEASPSSTTPTKPGGNRSAVQVACNALVGAICAVAGVSEQRARKCMKLFACAEEPRATRGYDKSKVAHLVQGRWCEHARSVRELRKDDFVKKDVNVRKAGSVTHGEAKRQSHEVSLRRSNVANGWDVETADVNQSQQLERSPAMTGIHAVTLKTQSMSNLHRTGTKKEDDDSIRLVIKPYLDQLPLPATIRTFSVGIATADQLEGISKVVGHPALREVQRGSHHYDAVFQQTCMQSGAENTSRDYNSDTESARLQI
ncbi:hypothetical protein P7C70_g3111, partial [Phenoliferia sp. Uapishka_3]